MKHPKLVWLAVFACLALMCEVTRTISASSEGILHAGSQVAYLITGIVWWVMVAWGLAVGLSRLHRWEAR